MASLVNNPQKDNKLRKPKQGKQETELAQKIRDYFVNWSSKRNTGFSWFGLNSSGSERTLIDAIDYSTKLVDNYRVKPSWKEEWQSNISDITLHSKLMAILANIISQRYIAEYHPRISSAKRLKFMANIMDDVAKYIYTQERNGLIDQLFTALKCLREPGTIKFVGYKKTTFKEGIDIQFVKLDEWYPERVDTFYMKDIHRCIWRKVWGFQAWKDARLNVSGFIDTDKVRSAGSVRSDDTTFFDVSVDLNDEQVEELLWFDEINNEYHIVANDILITPLDSKLTDISPGGTLPFVKTGYEPYDPGFIYYRSLAMIMGPNQEGIDFLFSGMFDKVMMDVMKPIFTGGLNEMVDDYIGVGQFVEVNDVKQIKEMDVKPLDLTAFRVLKELQDRNVMASVDSTSQGKVSLGNPTATEIERAQESAQRMFGLFNTMLTDSLQQEYYLTGWIILKYYFKNPNFKEFFVENSKLTNGKMGTKVIRLKPRSKLPVDRSQFGFSPTLATEVENEFDEQTEIIEIDAAKMYKDYEFKTEARPAPSVENSKFLKKALLNQKLVQMYGLPQLFDPKIVKKIDVENNRDILGEYSSELLQDMEQQQQTGLPAPLSAGVTNNQMIPQNQKATPGLDKLLSADSMI